jgi:hypothetical protein
MTSSLALLVSSLALSLLKSEFNAPLSPSLALLQALTGTFTHLAFLHAITADNYTVYQWCDPRLLLAELLQYALHFDWVIFSFTY